MKKHKKAILITFLVFAFIVSSLFIIFYYSTGLTQKADNHTDLHQVITRRYSQKKLDQLEKLVAENQLTLKSFKVNYRPQCIRETSQGEYAVLLGENEERFFVFWTKENKLYATYRTTEFLERENFSFAQSKPIILDDVLKLDKSTISIPGAAHKYTGHILKEGVLLLEYDNSLTLQKRTFVSNQDFLQQGNTAYFDFVPVILEQDKQ